MANSTIKLDPIVGNLKPVKLTTGYNSIDTLINNVFDGSGTQFCLIDNKVGIGELEVSSNRQQIFGWANDNKQYVHLLIMSFGGIYLATRQGSSTATITKLGGGKQTFAPRAVTQVAA